MTFSLDTVILLLRVHAMFERNKKLLVFLCTLLAVAVIGEVVIAGIISAQLKCKSLKIPWLTEISDSHLLQPFPFLRDTLVAPPQISNLGPGLFGYQC